MRNQGWNLKDNILAVQTTIGQGKIPNQYRLHYNLATTILQLILLGSKDITF